MLGSAALILACMEAMAEALAAAAEAAEGGGLGLERGEEALWIKR